MSDTFTASNGITVSVEPDGDTFLKNVPGSTRSVWLRKGTTSALREFFLHEADVWVDPETGAHVYRRPGSDDEDGRCIFTVVGGSAYFAWEEVVSDQQSRRGIVARYFAAHPEPRPWHDAEPDQVWSAVVDSTGGVRPLTVMEYQEEGRVFLDAYHEETYELTDPCITDAQQIWPVVKP